MSPLDLQDAGLVNAVVSDSSVARANAFTARMQAAHKNTGGKSLGTVGSTPSMPLTTNTLNTIWNNVNSISGRMITVCASPRVTKSTFYQLGDLSRAFSADEMMDDIVQSCLKCWNETWDGLAAASLTREDVLLRWHGNRNPEHESEHLTLGDFYDIHKRAANAEVYFGKVPPTWRGLKQQFICIEIFIDLDAFERCTQMKAPRPGLGAKRSSIGSMDPPSTKKLRNSGNGIVDIDWPHDDASSKTFHIDNDSIQQGKTKKVYKAMADGKQYVAKRFFNVGHGPDKVTMTENADQLQNELRRLKRGSWFLDEFFERAEQTNTEVSADFEFSQCLLAREIIGDGGPSPASGISAQDYVDKVSVSPDSAIVWLLEPRRSQAVTHYSGTMAYRDWKDKRGLTINAFTHFAYIMSDRALVFADIQCSNGMLSTNKPGHILFDVMTHTTDENSGVGDHGKKGVDEFVNQHKCRALCADLEMDPVREGVDGGNDDESDYEE